MDRLGGWAPVNHEVVARPAGPWVLARHFAERPGLAAATDDTRPLPYGGPGARAAGSTRLVVLVIFNAVAAIAGLWFVPLAAPIDSCTEGPK